jgi:3',5'-cyclic AMP phosphodiesterase CpdA
MPIHLPPIRRRDFLATTLAAGAGMFLPRSLWANEAKTDPNHFVLLSDIHIHQEIGFEHRGVKMAESLKRVAEEVLANSTRPAGAFVSGDCAFRFGMPGDYETLGKVIQPFRHSGIPLHLALGNHDQREHFLAAFPELKSAAANESPMPNKFVSVVETAHANWFLLDSLDKTTGLLGAFGEMQLAWLAKELDARPDKPALVMAHHHPEEFINYRGLADTKAFLKVILPRKQVKAYIYGHTHIWNVCKPQGGLYLVNIPSTAWQFDAHQPRGFVTAQLQASGATLNLHAFDPKHPKNGETVNLKWRT